jgi:hypothetical protein
VFEYDVLPHSKIGRLGKSRSRNTTMESAVRSIFRKMLRSVAPAVRVSRSGDGTSRYGRGVPVTAGIVARMGERNPTLKILWRSSDPAREFRFVRDLELFILGRTCLSSN